MNDKQFSLVPNTSFVIQLRLLRVSLLQSMVVIHLSPYFKKKKEEMTLSTRFDTWTIPKLLLEANRKFVSLIAVLHEGTIPAMSSWKTYEMFSIIMSIRLLIMKRSIVPCE